jgi:hypothetical protein
MLRKKMIRSLEQGKLVTSYQGRVSEPGDKLNLKNVKKNPLKKPKTYQKSDSTKKRKTK